MTRNIEDFPALTSFERVNPIPDSGKSNIDKKWYK